MQSFRASPHQSKTHSLLFSSSLRILQSHLMYLLIAPMTSLIIGPNMACCSMTPTKSLRSSKESNLGWTMISLSCNNQLYGLHISLQEACDGQSCSIIVSFSNLADRGRVLGAKVEAHLSFRKGAGCTLFCLLIEMSCRHFVLGSLPFVVFPCNSPLAKSFFRRHTRVC